MQSAAEMLAAVCARLVLKLSALILQEQAVLVFEKSVHALLAVVVETETETVRFRMGASVAVGVCAQLVVKLSALTVQVQALLVFERSLLALLSAVEAVSEVARFVWCRLLALTVGALTVMAGQTAVRFFEERAAALTVVAAGAGTEAESEAETEETETEADIEVLASPRWAAACARQQATAEAWVVLIAQAVVVFVEKRVPAVSAAVSVAAVCSERARLTARVNELLTAVAGEFEL